MSLPQSFLEHANQEQQHADWLAERIVQLGNPNFSPEGLQTRSHAEFVEGETLREMVEEDLVAERIAIDSYRESPYLGDEDPTSRRIVEVRRKRSMPTTWPVDRRHDPLVRKEDDRS